MPTQSTSQTAPRPSAPATASAQAPSAKSPNTKRTQGASKPVTFTDFAAI